MANEKHINRRDVLKGLSVGLAAAVGGKGLCFAAEQAGGIYSRQADSGIYTRSAKPAWVSLVKGNDRRDIVYGALKKVEDQVVGAIGSKKILIKPNMVSTNKPLCATHVDALRGILDFLKPHVKAPITIGESTASRAGTFDGYVNYGYLALEKEYNVKLVDLNKMPFVYRYVFGKGNRPLPIRIISTFLDPDVCIISAACMKTHDRVLATLSLKNVLLAAPLNDGKKSDKSLTHTQGKYEVNTVLHYNMFHLAQEIFPDVSVIDGFVGMEGNGPVGGEPVDSRVALASTDPVAADITAMRVMGFDPKRILYLNSLAEAGMGQGDYDKITLSGTPLDECLCKFKMSKHMVASYGQS